MGHRSGKWLAGRCPGSRLLVAPGTGTPGTGGGGRFVDGRGGVGRRERPASAARRETQARAAGEKRWAVPGRASAVRAVAGVRATQAARPAVRSRAQRRRGHGRRWWLGWCGGRRGRGGAAAGNGGASGASVRAALVVAAARLERAARRVRAAARLARAAAPGRAVARRRRQSCCPEDGGWCWFEAPRALFQGSR
jgi:hypothetical protein